jgi:tetratricopeptide (TPR) repeat protein
MLQYGYTYPFGQPVIRAPRAKNGLAAFDGADLTGGSPMNAVLIACLLAAGPAGAKDDPDLDRTIAETSATLRIRPGDADALLMRANAWFLKHEYDKAIADASAVIRLDPACTEAYSVRAAALFSTGQFARAITDYDVIIAREPGDASDLESRGLK